MPTIKSKKELAVILSHLDGFSEAKVSLEQYQSDPEIAAAVLWEAFMDGHIEGKDVADLGSGTGILGLGALLLGADRVFFVESEHEAMRIAQHNKIFLDHEFGLSGKAVFQEQDIVDFEKKVDLVVQNPPFGTKQKHADKAFLEKAFVLSKAVYSFHKSETAGFVNSIARDHGFFVEKRYDFVWSLKQTMAHHKKKKQEIMVSCWKLMQP